MRCVGTSVVIVHRVIPIEVGAWGDSIGIAGPESTSIFRRVEPERVAVFSQAVEIRVCGQGRTEAEILRLEDQGGSGGVEEGVPARFPRYGKGKGRVDVGEVEIGACRIDV